MRLSCSISAALILLGTSLSLPARDITLRLLAFDPSTVQPGAHVFDPAVREAPGVASPIKGFLNHEGVKLTATGNELLFSRSANSNNAAKPESLIATARLPAAGSRFILIFLPGAAGKAPVLVVDDSVAGFPLGSYQVFNLGRKPVRLVLESKPFEYAPGKGGIIRDPPVQENQHSAMYAFTETDGKWERIGSGLWPHPGTRRSIQLFFENPATGRTELKGFRDIAPPTEP